MPDANRRRYKNYKIKPTVIDTAILSLAYGADGFFSVHRFAHMIFNSASDVSLSLPYMSLKNILQITILRFLFYYSFKTLVFFFFEANAKTCRQYLNTVYSKELQNWLVFVQFSCRSIVYTATQFLLYSTLRTYNCVTHIRISKLLFTFWLNRFLVLRFHAAFDIN